ncbi:DUF6884 domain-containing protein [Halalkalicoccus ordinarius]|uniref:DUF6884 domain-containing protein n=1 Tax=Halalkalicoccus ordinarius TaxID=3116651 RepID=UPI00300F0C4D
MCLRRIANSEFAVGDVSGVWKERKGVQSERFRKRSSHSNINTTLVIHAGKAYYEPLLPLFENNPVSIEIPTEGLYLSETLAWYNDHS